MNSTVIQKINRQLQNIRLKRHQLLIVVTDRFHRNLKFVSEDLEFPYINVNYELSEVLKDVPVKRRPRKVSEALKNIIKNKNNDTLVLDNIEILFDPQLQQNPILLLEDISRNYTLIVGWKGKFQNRKLIYAEPEHDEFFTYENTEGIIIEDNVN